MLPISSESWQKLANQEGKLLLALDDIKTSRIKSIRAAAKLYDIPRSTLQTRANGVLSIVERRLPGHKLTQYEEDSLVEWVLSLDSCGTAPRQSTIREIANILLTSCSESPLSTVGVN